jgi:hypothetical protein
MHRYFCLLRYSYYLKDQSSLVSLRDSLEYLNFTQKKLNSSSKFRNRIRNKIRNNSKHAKEVSPDFYEDEFL